MPTLNWLGKDKVVNHHADVPYHVLDKKYTFTSRNYVESELKSKNNRIIHGDNLIALKSLLPDFEGEIDCIYIDPPYNTGNEGWVYNDNVNDPRITKWLGEVVGKDGEDLSRHDKWLCMMFPRLKLLHKLLADDGVIFISIDDNEDNYLSIILEEIFGRNNFVQEFVWKKSYGGGSKSKYVVNLHEKIYCYAKNINLLTEINLPPDEQSLKYYKFKDEKFALRGAYRLQPLATNSMDDRPNLRYPIFHEGYEIWPEKQWQWSRERVLQAQEDNSLEFKKKGETWTVSYKQYLKNEKGEERGSKPYSIIDGLYTQQGTNEIKLMFGDGKAFNFPKPSELVRYLLSFINNKNGIILDSFAGSGTTAHAVLKLNQQDGGNRKFILCEMMDYAEDITAERVRRVMNGYGNNSSKVEGLEGSFDFYQIGEPIFTEEGMLNEKVGIERIRSYISHSEKIPNQYRLELNNEICPSAIGHNHQTLWLLHYQENTVTSLDLDFLSRIKLKHLIKRPTQFVIYADKCALDEKFMLDKGIVFKRIPRDIFKF